LGRRRWLFRGRRRILRFLIRRRVLRRDPQRQPQNQCQGGSSQPVSLPSKSRHAQVHFLQEKAIPPSYMQKLRQSDAGIPPGVGRNYFCTRMPLALPGGSRYPGGGPANCPLSGRDNRGDSP
jgi:hypothetical protein